MDAVTYPHRRVKEELENWVLLKIDVAKRRQVAELLQVTAVPVAVALTSEGDELGRLENFVEPAAFRRWLSGLHRD